MPHSLRPSSILVRYISLLDSYWLFSSVYAPPPSSLFNTILRCNSATMNKHAADSKCTGTPPMNLGILNEHVHDIRSSIVFEPHSSVMLHILIRSVLSFSGWVELRVIMCMSNQRELPHGITSLEFMPTGLQSQSSSQNTHWLHFFYYATWCSTVLEGVCLSYCCSLLGTHPVNSFSLQTLFDAVLHLSESGIYVEGKIKLSFQPSFLVSEGDKLPTLQDKVCLLASVTMSVLGSEGVCRSQYIFKFTSTNSLLGLSLSTCSKSCYIIQPIPAIVAKKNPYKKTYRSLYILHYWFYNKWFVRSSHYITTEIILQSSSGSVTGVRSTYLYLLVRML